MPWRDTPPDLTFWDQSAKNDLATAVIDPRDRRGHKTRFIHELQVRALEDVLSELPRAEHALDFGCGRGRLTPLLARHAERTTGLDTGETLLAGARASTVDPRISFMQYDGSRLPLSDGEIDLCLSVAVLQYMVGRDEHASILRDLARVIRAGGSLLLLEQIRPDSGAGWRQTTDGYARHLAGYGFSLRKASTVRNGRDALTYLVGFGLVPLWLLSIAEGLERRLAAAPPLPWTHYRDALMLFRKE